MRVHFLLQVDEPKPQQRTTAPPNNGVGTSGAGGDKDQEVSVLSLGT